MEMNKAGNNTDLNKDATMDKDEAKPNILADDHLSSTTPPVSLKSTSTITTLLSLTPTSSLTTAPLQPEPSLTTKAPMITLEHMNNGEQTQSDLGNCSEARPRSRLLDIF